MRTLRVDMLKRPRLRTTRASWLGWTAGFALMAMAPVVGRGLLQFPHIPLEMTRLPDANRLKDINENSAKLQKIEAVNAERKKQIAQDSAQLLKLATELKSEVDKTNKDMLSIGVIRKAEAIEKLAHNVKEKMKVSIGAS